MLKLRMEPETEAWEATMRKLRFDDTTTGDVHVVRTFLHAVRAHATAKKYEL
jgi:hypothetical protein